MFASVHDYLRRPGERCDSMVRLNRHNRGRQSSHSLRCLAALLVLAVSSRPLLAQEKPSQQRLKGINADIIEMMHAAQQTPASPAKRSITLSDAVSIFLQQNLQLVAGRYDIEMADAEKLT